MSSLDQKILQLVDMLSFLSRDEDRLHVSGRSVGLNWRSVSRSALLKTRISCLPSERGSIFSDNWAICKEASAASIIQRTMSAWSSFWKVRSIPILSIASCVSRMPAVSMKRKVIPPMLIVSSMTSRVVPWMSLTIALSSFSRTFSRVDFPAFVSPMIATGMPFLIAFPTLKELARRDMTVRYGPPMC